MWITADDVINFHGLKPQHLNLNKDDTNTLKTILEDWISQSESLILSYCNIRSINDADVNNALKNVCLRLTSNMVSLAIQRRDNPIIKVNDWTIQNIGSDIFTEDLKKDLAPFINDSSNREDAIGIYTITGKDIVW